MRDNVLQMANNCGIGTWASSCNRMKPNQHLELFQASENHACTASKTSSHRHKYKLGTCFLSLSQTTIPSSYMQYFFWGLCLSIPKLLILSIRMSLTDHTTISWSLKAWISELFNRSAFSISWRGEYDIHFLPPPKQQRGPEAEKRF